MTAANHRALRIASADVQLAVHEYGPASAPTIVLLHGYPDTSATWGPLVELLAPRFHIVTYDARGSGDSTRPARRAAYRIERLVGDLARVLEVTTEGPVHLVGHDWGAIAGWEAVTDPRTIERIASFTAVGGPSLDHAGARLHEALRLRPAAMLDVARQLPRSWYVFLFQLPLLPELVWRLGLGHLFRRRLHRVEGFARATAFPAPSVAVDGAHGVQLYRANILRRLFRPRPAPIAVPVHVIVGKRDPFVSSKAAREAGAWVADLRVTTLSGRHWLQHTHASELAAAIEAFVAG